MTIVTAPSEVLVSVLALEKTISPSGHEAWPIKVLQVHFPDAPKKDGLTARS
jgi:hypothetical protein